MKVALTTSSFGKFSQEPLDLLRAEGFAIVPNPHHRTLGESEAVALMQGCVGVVAGTEPLTAKVIEALPELRVISRCGVGMDNVDMEAAAKRGILVRSTPDGPTRAVAELTLGFALALLRQVGRMDKEMRAGQWKKRMGNLLHEKNVGIIGFGRIGRMVASLFAAFGCRVAFHDPQVNEDQGEFRCLSKEEIIRWADILTLHTAKAPGGGYVLDAAHIARMKEGAWLINTSRGGTVEESALVQALHEGALAGAALDVYEREPYPYSGPLTRMPQVIITPHIGSYAKEARIRMEVNSVINLIEALREAQGSGN